MARTTHSTGQQNTLGTVSDPVNALDIVNKESLPHPTPVVGGLHSTRWQWESSGPDQQVNFDPLGRPFTGTADRFPGIAVTLKRLHLWIDTSSHAGAYLVLRKNGANVHTYNVSTGGIQQAIDVSYTQHAGPPLTYDLGAWYINGTAAGGNTSGLMLVEFNIDGDIIGKDAE